MALEIDELEQMPLEASLEEQVKWLCIQHKDRRLEIEGISAEIKRLQERKAYLEVKQDDTRAMIEKGLHQLGQDKMKFPGLITLSMTTRKASWAIADEKATLDWAKANKPELVKVTESLDKTGFKELATSYMLENGGELIPGLERVPESKTLTIREAK